MKNFSIIITAILLLTGCASTINLDRGIVKSSEPIFVDTKPLNKKTYVKFTNTSRADSNLTAALQHYLSLDGYEIVADEGLAAISIKGNLDYLRQKVVYSGYYPAYYPYGFWGRRYYYDDFYRDREYIYDAGVLLLLTIKDGDKSSQYRTNLTFESDRNLYSLSSITEILNYQIYKRVKNYIESSSKNSGNLDERR